MGAPFVRGMALSAILLRSQGVRLTLQADGRLQPYATRFEAQLIQVIDEQPFATGTLLERVAMNFSGLPMDFLPLIVLGKP